MRGLQPVRHVCPVPECITLRTLAPGEKDARTGKTGERHYANWTTHPNNPMRKPAGLTGAPAAH
jgi:dihydropyrimidine dehydrogenase (NAD+) subunit PreA